MASSAIERLAGVFALLLLLFHGAATADALQITRVETAVSEQGSFAPAPPHLPVEALPGNWQDAALPFVAPREILPAAATGNEVVARWFRVRLDDGALKGEERYLYVPRWQSVGKIAVYGDGRLLYRSVGSTVWNGYNHPLWIPLSGADHATPRELLIRMDSRRGAGGAISTLWIGTEKTLGPSRFARDLVQAGLPETSSVAFLFIGFFSLAVWTRRRRESIYLLFFASSVLSWIRSMHYYLGQEPLPISDDWFGWLTVTSVGWFILTVYFFSYRLHGRHYPRVERWLVGLMSLATLLLLPPLNLSPDLGLLAPLAYLLLLGVVVVVMVVMGFAAWRSRSKEALLFSAWNMSALPFGVHDWMLQNYKLSIEGIYLLPYFSMGTFFLFMFIVFRRYTGAIGEVEALNRGLEDRLRQREAQLAESYARLREAEHQRILADERQRLVRDMHDGFGSSLIGALSVVEQGGTAQVDVAQVLRECIDDLRLIVDSLEPLDADLSLLLASLRYRLEPRLAAAGITLHWNPAIERRLEWLTPRSALQILRILQEVFTNILKHAGARRITLTASEEHGHVIIAVEDDGRGFDPENGARAGGGRGLSNIDYRAAAIGAAAHWDSRPGHTRFQLRMPIIRQAHQTA